MNIQRIRADFPLLHMRSNDKPIVYLDNASTSQKPSYVLDAMMHFYTHDYANVHRGVYRLAEQATMHYERAREIIADALGARDASDIVFTRGTTESINLVAASWAQHALRAGDEIIVPESEHHANFVPWQQLAESHGVRFILAPVHADGTLVKDVFATLLTSRTKLIAFSHVSQVTGVTHDVAYIVQKARSVGARVLLDAAQSIPHQKLNVTELDVDFCAFSGHKMLGPTGSGVLYIKRELHDAMLPYQTGGGMVYTVERERSTWLPVPHRLEAGTPAIAQVIGLAAACTYLRERIDMVWLRQHEASLCAKLIDGLHTIKGVSIIGPVEELKKQGHLVSFSMEGIHPHDIAAYLSEYGICVRAGHHCAQPLAKRLGLDASVRISFYCYNTEEEVEYCIDALNQARSHLIR